jgi:hypothetical protein
LFTSGVVVEERGILLRETEAIMERTGRFALATAAAAALAALHPLAALAAPDAETKCIAAKTKLVGEMFACLQKSEARRILTGRNNPCDVLKFRDRWEAIEERAGGACPVEQHDGAAAIFGSFEFSREMALQIHPPTKIVIFDAGPTDGAFTAIDSDVSCQGMIDGETLTCDTLTPVISTSERSLTQALSSLAPRDIVPFYSLSGVKIADDLNDFLEFGWDSCLQTSTGPDCPVAAGVLPDGVFWWHGSDPESPGGLSDNCNDFSSTNPFYVGNVGLASSAGGESDSSQWDGLVAECDGSNLPAPAHLICACGQR